MKRQVKGILCWFQKQKHHTKPVKMLFSMSINLPQPPERQERVSYKMGNLYLRVMTKLSMGPNFGVIILQTTQMWMLSLKIG